MQEMRVISLRTPEGKAMNDMPVTFPLQRSKPTPYNPAVTAIHWSKCLPFVESSRGVLIHRPRMVTTYKIGKHKPHLSVTCWCGNTRTGKTEITFLAVPDECRIVCQRCEEIAVKNALPTSDQIAGRHVHKGGMIAVPKCCTGAKP